MVCVRGCAQRYMPPSGLMGVPSLLHCYFRGCELKSWGTAGLEQHIDVNGREEAEQMQTREPIRNYAQHSDCYFLMNRACLHIVTAPPLVVLHLLSREKPLKGIPLSQKDAKLENKCYVLSHHKEYFQM